MKALVEAGDYSTAAAIADTINWRKIKNVTALIRAGEIYEQVERYEESRDILLMAYSRSPIGRMIIYRLACVAIKMGEYDEARTYCREFAKIAPYDNLKYVLKYQINKAQGVDYKTLIDNLEELKEQEFTEEWGYELAYLYHQAGMPDQCIEVCNDLILYFGQGLYVEKALELKMLYQPLSALQEEKYRQFTQQKAGITEVYSDDRVESAEIVENVDQIPQITISQERFNTQNLQKTLQKSMQKIMGRMEKETVGDYMDAIKKRAEEMPYPQPVIEKNNEKKNSEEKKIVVVPEQKRDDVSKVNFQELLNEESDGQLQIFVPDYGVRESQIDGQMTIEEILAEQETMQDVAMAALQAEEQRKLELEKARALQEAEDIMERLVDVIPKLEAGIPASSLTSRYHSDNDLEEIHTAQMVANMNHLLQKEIERLSSENAQIDEQLSVAQELSQSVKGLEAAIIEETIAEDFPEECLAEVVKTVSEEILENIPREPTISEVLLPEETVGSIIVEEAEEEFFAEMESGFAAMVQEEVSQKAFYSESQEMEILPKMKFSSDFNSTVKITSFTEEQREMFSYFTSVKGMEEQICLALSSIASRLESGGSAGKGNLIVQGGSGTGKTAFAMNFIQALRKMTGKPDGKVVKVEAEALNQKDLGRVYTKIAGGCLIIEGVGELSNDSLVKLGMLFSGDTQGTLLIIEDVKQGIEKALIRDEVFASMFTERIIVPIFTNDELVNFGKAYAKENGYRIDDMGVLALYKCISNIQKLDKETTIAEVKEIVDDAIKEVESGALKKALSILTSSRFDKEDYVILHEKDFNI